MSIWENAVCKRPSERGPLEHLVMIGFFIGFLPFAVRNSVRDRLIRRRMVKNRWMLK